MVVKEVVYIIRKNEGKWPCTSCGKNEIALNCCLMLALIKDHLYIHRPHCKMFPILYFKDPNWSLSVVPILHFTKLHIACFILSYFIIRPFVHGSIYHSFHKEHQL